MNVSIQLPNKRKQQIRWSPKSPRARNFTSKPINEEFQKLKQYILDYELENNFIRETSAAFRELETNESAGEFLASQFDLELQEISKRIDQRSQKIDNLIQKSKMKSIRPKKEIQGSCQKSQVIEENRFLVEQALSLEQQNILYHLKLKVCHDHRDLCKLKCDITKITEGESLSDEEKEILQNKLIIRNLKKYIEHEKKRAHDRNIKQTPEDEAATAIQKSWRGYMARKEFRRSKQMNYTQNQNYTNDSSSQNHQPNNEYDNTEEYLTDKNQPENNMENDTNGTMLNQDNEQNCEEEGSSPIENNDSYNIPETPNSIHENKDNNQIENIDQQNDIVKDNECHDITTSNNNENLYSAENDLSNEEMENQEESINHLNENENNTENDENNDQREGHHEISSQKDLEISENNNTSDIIENEVSHENVEHLHHNSENED